MANLTLRMADMGHGKGAVVMTRWWGGLGSWVGSERQPESPSLIRGPLALAGQPGRGHGARSRQRDHWPSLAMAPCARTPSARPALRSLQVAGAPCPVRRACHGPCIRPARHRQHRGRGLAGQGPRQALP